jgi:hypothetical protein
MKCKILDKFKDEFERPYSSNSQVIFRIAILSTLDDSLFVEVEIIEGSAWIRYKSKSRIRFTEHFVPKPYLDRSLLLLNTLMNEDSRCAPASVDGLGIGYSISSPDEAMRADFGFLPKGTCLHENIKFFVNLCWELSWKMNDLNLLSKICQRFTDIPLFKVRHSFKFGVIRFWGSLTGDLIDVSFFCDVLPMPHPLIVDLRRIDWIAPSAAKVIMTAAKSRPLLFVDPYKKLNYKKLNIQMKDVFATQGGAINSMRSRTSKID